MLESLYNENEIKQFSALTNTTRRLSNKDEITIQANHLCQSIDVDIYLEGNVTVDMINMKDYPYRSIENTIEYIYEIKKSNINTVLLHLVGNEYGQDPYKVLQDHVQAIQQVRKHFSKEELNITIDPFMTAFNQDGSWGVKDEFGKLKYLETLNLLAEIATDYSLAGADGIITLGRVEGEVEVTKKALAKISSNMKIKSFSQNTETTNAYMYLENLPDQLETGQKILVGNLTEMNLRTILDIHEGADVIIVKPIENFHLITLTLDFITNTQSVAAFLNSAKAKELLEANPFVKHKVDQILADLDAFEAKCAGVTVGAYSVSGTYFIHKSFEKEKGGRFSLGLMDELLKNAISAAGDRLDSILDRNAMWIIQNK
ncbi:delta-aminolevulinic acid dehydratase [Paenibacillus sp. MMS18-CY102]|nr:delta-aminolevulinic acid dehydratase [Paenibacillus sp. MMS18-CY102]